jgi:drug/metabolite transporter (DMT)-like permease
VRRAAPSARSLALLQALLVTFLWSTSWVLIKIGLEDLVLPPLTFAGLRYVLAAILLLPLALPALRRLPTGVRANGVLVPVVVLGLLLYSVAQGAQFAALVHLPAVAVALVLSTTPVLVALVGLRGHERPTAAQVGGTVAVVVGAALYLGPLELSAGAGIGLAIAAIGVLANAASALLGRRLARDHLSAVGGVIGLTALTMAVGSTVLLMSGLLIEGVPALPAEAWLVVGWLALVNTAFAFTLWNHTLRTLTAVESSVMNNLMLIQIAVLAWVFLGESLDARQLLGLAVALAGVIGVQLRSSGRVAGRPLPAERDPAVATTGDAPPH